LFFGAAKFHLEKITGLLSPCFMIAVEMVEGKKFKDTLYHTPGKSKVGPKKNRDFEPASAQPADPFSILYTIAFRAFFSSSSQIRDLLTFLAFPLLISVSKK
jgi:hypothetical protein